MQKKSNNKQNVLLWGARSKARIIDAMLSETKKYRTSLIFDATLSAPEFETKATFCNQINDLNHRIKGTKYFVVCIGGEHGYARVKTSEALIQWGLKPLDLIHKDAFLEKTSMVGIGVHIMPGAVVHKFSSIGKYCIINTNSTIDHECQIGDGVHIMGNAALAGQVKVGNYATIGTNATILPRIEIGEGAYVGAGAVVTKNVKPYEVVLGNPSRVLRKRENQFDSIVLKLLKFKKGT